MEKQCPKASNIAPRLLHNISTHLKDLKTSLKKHLKTFPKSFTNKLAHYTALTKKAYNVTNPDIHIYSHHFSNIRKHTFTANPRGGGFARMRIWIV